MVVCISIYSDSILNLIKEKEEYDLRNQKIIYILDIYTYIKEKTKMEYMFILQQGFHYDKSGTTLGSMSKTCMHDSWGDLVNIYNTYIYVYVYIIHDHDLDLQ